MSVNSKLRAIADQLPPTPKYDDKGKIVYTIKKSKVLGADILKQHPDAIELGKDGAEIPMDPKRMYMANTQVAVMSNHFEALRYFYDMHGAEGVNKYIDQCFAYNKLQKPDAFIFSNEAKIIRLN